MSDKAHVRSLLSLREMRKEETSDVGDLGSGLGMYGDGDTRIRTRSAFASAEKTCTVIVPNMFGVDGMLLLYQFGNTDTKTQTNEKETGTVPKGHFQRMQL